MIFMPSLVETGPVILEKMKIWRKVYNNDANHDDNNDDGQIVIRKIHLSLWLRWANNYL